MKIALVQYRPAIRLYKYAVTLKRLGHDITVVHSKDQAPDLHWNRFNDFDVRYQKNWVEKANQNFDLWISFNANNGLSHPTGLEIPVIQAVGDLSGVYGRHEFIEIEALRKSACNIFISHAQEEWAYENYRVQGKIFYNGVLSEMIGEPKTRKTGTVYAGTLSGKPEHNRNIIKQLEMYPKVHIYPSSLGLPEGYDGKNLIIHETVKPYDLISELSQYKTGLILMSDQTIANMALPNKLFEYMAAGLLIEGTLSTEAKQIILEERLHTYEDYADYLQDIVTKVKELN